MQSTRSEKGLSGRSLVVVLTEQRFHEVRGHELAKILGHSNIKMTERYAKLAQKHIARTGNTAREMWKLMEGEAGNPREQARA